MGEYHTFESNTNGWTFSNSVSRCPVNRHTDLTVNEWWVLLMLRCCMPVKGLVYIYVCVCAGPSLSLWATCVTLLRHLPSDLSILLCLLREGWIPLCEQYPHASFGFVKVFTSSSCAFWEVNNACQTMAKLHTQIKNWHCKTFFLQCFPLQMTVGRRPVRCNK